MISSIMLLAIVAIIVGCAIFQYLKSTLVKAFATAIAATCASAVALGFFKVLANTLVSFSGGSSLLEQWGPLLCFVLLFVVAFAILQTIVNQLTRRPIDLGLWPERIGRAASGFFLGFTLSRILFSVLIMTGLLGMQISAPGKYFSYKGIEPPKQTPQKEADKPSRKRESRLPKESKTTPQKEKLSDTSKSILGPGFEE